MTAAVLTNPGPSPAPPECFTYSTSYPRPSLPSPDWTLCRVRAAGLNRAELRGRAALPPGLGEFNIFQAEYHAEPPAVLGEEFVGEVEEAGSGSGFNRGEKVTGFIYGGGKAHDGAYAQFTVCHKRRLFRLPETQLPWSVLGAIPMSMWTAYGSLFEAGRLGVRGKEASVLVHGGTSSVGLWAILLAKDQGHTVIATTRNKTKVDRLRKSGADHVVLEEDMEIEIPKLYPKGVDVVLELVGPDALKKSLSLTARFGTVVCTGVLSKQWGIEGFRPSMIPTCRNLSFYGMTNRASLGPEDEGLEMVESVLEDVVRKVETGLFSPDVFLDKEFALKDVGHAHAYMEDNMAVGKVILTVP
jgi:NADPH2:quinone reductase